MNNMMRFAYWQAALFSGVLLAGCAPQSERSDVATAPVTMVCDGGRTFTVAYANNFETAVVEAGGQRLELPRLYSAASIPSRFEAGSTSFSTPFPGPSRSFGDGDDLGRLGGGRRAAATTGVRYGTDEALFVSRNDGAVLQLGDETYSNCDVARS